MPPGGYYRPATYLLAKMVLDALLLRVIPVFIFAAPFYPMVRCTVCSVLCSCTAQQLCAWACGGWGGPCSPTAPDQAAEHPTWAPAAALLPALQMGLQSGSAVVATFLFVAATFAAGELLCCVGARAACPPALPRPALMML